MPAPVSLGDQGPVPLILRQLDHDLSVLVPTREDHGVALLAPTLRVTRDHGVPFDVMSDWRITELLYRSVSGS